MYDYICLECLEVFDDPDYVTYDGERGASFYDRIAVCPYCGGAIRSTIICDHCGDYITDDYISIDRTGERICENCFTKIDFGSE